MERDAALEAVFQPVRPPTTFEETVERLGTAIRLGLLAPGSRLPPERELAAELRISRSTLREAITTLTQSGHLLAQRGRGGGTFVVSDPPLADPWEIVDTIWAAMNAGMHRGDLEAVRDRLDPGRLAIIERGRGLDAATLAEALIRRNAYVEGMRRFMANGGYDLLLTPALPCTAFAAGDDDPGTVAGRPTTYLGWTAFTYPFNLTGQPAATVPCGFAPDGLPVGLQIVGRWRDDTTVLRAAAAFEAMVPWADAWPPPR